MNILMACNSSYFLPTLVTMHSVLVNNPCPVTFYMLSSSLTEEQLERMKNLVEESGHGIVITVTVSQDTFADNKPQTSYITHEAYYRLLAQKLLPESVDRYLWLDGDIIVAGNIEEFYHQDLEGKLLCACNDVLLTTFLKRKPNPLLPRDVRYFNSGVYLADLAAQRKTVDPDIYENYLRLFEKRLAFADQDILNAVFYRCVKYADEYVYNMTPMYLEDMTPEQRTEVRRNVKIVHYCGGYAKPWQAKCSVLWSRIWWDYAEALPEYAGRYEELRPEQEKSRKEFLQGQFLRNAKKIWAIEKQKIQEEKKDETKR